MEEMAAYFTLHRQAWRAAPLWPPEEHDWMAVQIDSALAYVRDRSVARPQAFVDRLVGRVKADAYTPVYAIQSVVSEWIGDTRLVQETLKRATVTTVHFG